MPPSTDLHIFRSGVKPMWEDPGNRLGGKFVVRGGNPETIEGDWPAKRIIMIEFADRAALMAWYDSPEYADLKAMRIASSSGNIIAVDGA